MTIKVGITGGIGSGKSTVCNIFKLLGIPVFDADAVAKKLQNTHPKIKKELIHLFGKEIYTEDNVIDRKKLASIIFNDDIQLEKVNKLIHPVVREEYETWLKKKETPYIIHEAAILFESGFYKMMDFTISIEAPEELRIKRVVKRDKISAELVLKRIEKQWSDEKKRQLASFVINNDNKRLIIPDILMIDKNLKEYGKIW